MRAILLVLTIHIYGLSLCQTKSETILWLNTKLKYSPLYTDALMTSALYININNDCTFKITKDCWRKDDVPLLDKPVFYMQFTGNFKDLNPNSVIIEEDNGIQIIRATCTNNKECITQKTYDKNSSEFYNNTSVTLCYIKPNTEPNLANRVKNAIIHLIKLCGGKSETF